MSLFLKYILYIIISFLLAVFSIFYLVDGHDSSYYLKFTSKKQTSLILGNSRSAQGIRPDIINAILDRNDIYNYAFTLSSSPYGQLYFNSIKNKLTKKEIDGIFIIEVSPRSISINQKNEKESSNFRESDKILAISYVNYSPNFHYLFTRYPKKYFNILLKDKNLFLHDDGWLEVTVPMDSISVQKRTVEHFKMKEDQVYNWKISDYRIESLYSIIKYLKKYGDVYLIRMPLSKIMIDFETIISSDFEIIMKKISKDLSVEYFSFFNDNENYKFTDGNHLHKESALRFSKILAYKLKMNMKDK
jgi:hypothetical protein